MIRNILLIIFISISLVSCSDTKEVDTIGTTGLTTYEGNHFFIDVPSSWKVIENKDKTLPKPSSGDISLAIASTKLTDGFANNLLILSSKLKKITSSSDFSILNNIGADKEYLNYRKIDSKEFVFNDGEKSMLYIFEAKYNLDTPKLRFLQTAYICNRNYANFFTIALSSQIRDTSKYEAFLKTFTCK